MTKTIVMKKKLFIGALTMIIGSVALAQDRAHDPALHPAVLKEKVELTSTQERDIKRIHKQYDKKRAKQVKQAEHPAIAERHLNMRERKEVMAVLTPEQRATLHPKRTAHHKQMKHIRPGEHPKPRMNAQPEHR
jgi:hypothetical protein